MKIEYPEIGVCGLSCRLCPNYQSTSASRCGGCKSDGRMRVGCPFITCAAKKRGIEFCWQCPEQEGCERWHGHRRRGQIRDSFVCYQRLEKNIAFVRDRGISAFVEDQRERENLLLRMLNGFNEGRSKSFYCIVATVMDTQEITRAIAQVEEESAGGDVLSRRRALHAWFERIAKEKNYNLKLRK